MGRRKERRKGAQEEREIGKSKRVVGVQLIDYLLLLLLPSSSLLLSSPPLPPLPSVSSLLLLSSSLPLLLPLHLYLPSLSSLLLPLLLPLPSLSHLIGGASLHQEVTQTVADSPTHSRGRLKVEHRVVWEKEGRKEKEERWKMD